MSFLLHFFADDVSLAQDLARNEPLLQQSIQNYFSTLERKTAVATAIVNGDTIDRVLPSLRAALADEIAILHAVEESEGTSITNIGTLEKHFKAFRKISATMDHALSRERYVYNLMRQLHDLLLDEARTVRQLDREQERQTVESLVGQIFLEQQAAQKLRGVGNLEELYENLAMGERRKHEVEKQEQPAAQDMLLRMQMTGQIGDKNSPMKRDSVTLLHQECYKRIEEAIFAAVTDGMLVRHTNVDFEFVNSALFEQIVGQIIDEHKLIDMNDKNNIRLFIHLFREIYNNRYEKEL